MTLEGSLDATVSEDQVAFTLTVTNAGDQPVNLQFMTGCKADFAVEDDGEEVWRFTEGRMFTQVISSETIEPGQSARYGGVWHEPESGEYTAIGELGAQGAECEARTDFSVM